MICQQRQALSQAPLCVYVSAYEPSHEKGEEDCENDPFDYHAFLFLLLALIPPSPPSLEENLHPSTKSYHSTKCSRHYI